MTASDLDRYLQPTDFLDADAAEVQEFADRALDAAGLDRDSARTDKAVALFHAVRDGFRYDPYDIASDPADYRASAVVGTDSAWCVTKSVVLAASARAVGIPARLGFADVKNHLTSAKLSASMGTDLFAWHGFAELLLPDGAGVDDSRGERWFKLSSAFNIELCERFGVKVLEFDGTADALMHPFDEAGNRHMEYVRERGSFDDLPLEQILADFAVIYPDTLVAGPGGAEAAGDDEFA